jgi:phosphatidylglycerophosphate synthase
MALASAKTLTTTDKGLWTVPNAISILRPIVLVPTLIKLYQTLANPAAARWWIVVAGLILAADMLDGWIARNHNQETQIGRLIDPSCDKLVGFMCLGFMLVVLDDYLGWGALLGVLAAVIGIRLAQDIISTRLYARDWKTSQVKGSNFPGKIKTWAELIGSAFGLIWLVEHGRSQANISAWMVLAGCSLSAILATISLRRKLTQ